DGSMTAWSFKLSGYNYSLVCHQNADKCFEINGSYFLVCARCTGIYFGALISSVLFLIGFNIKFKTLTPLIYSTAFLLLDVVLTTAEVYSYSQTIASLTGLILGSIVYIYIIEILEMFFLHRENNLYEK
ncbi:MAG TPA: DUF2085 domain-containing protein, partial [Ignavibacteriaceae bacterium]